MAMLLCGAGFWDDAEQKLLLCRDLYTKLMERRFNNAGVSVHDANMKADMLDGPTESLLGVIQKHGGKKPPDWDGWRRLVEK